MSKIVKLKALFFILVCVLSVGLVFANNEISLKSIFDDDLDLKKMMFESNIFGNQDELDKELLKSYLENDIKKIRLLLEYGSNPNIKITNESLLFYASESGNLEIFELLLRYGAELKDESEYKIALMCAAMEKRIDILKLLVDRGVDLNIRSISGKTALMYAVEKGYLEIVKFLVDHGSDVSIRSMEGETALLFACRDHRYFIAKYLLDHNANINVKSLYDKSVLMRVLQGENIKLKHYLAKQNVELYRRWSFPKNEYKKRTDIALLKLLLDYGANVNAIDEYGRTALMSAGKNDDLGAIELLLEYGADVTFKNHYGWTASNFVTLRGIGYIVRLLDSCKMTKYERALLISNAMKNQQIRLRNKPDKKNLFLDIPQHMTQMFLQFLDSRSLACLAVVNRSMFRYMKKLNNKHKHFVKQLIRGLIALGQVSEVKELLSFIDYSVLERSELTLGVVNVSSELLETENREIINILKGRKKETDLTTFSFQGREVLILVNKFKNGDYALNTIEGHILLQKDVNIIVDFLGIPREELFRYLPYRVSFYFKFWTNLSSEVAGRLSIIKKTRNNIVCYVMYDKHKLIDILCFEPVNYGLLPYRNKFKYLINFLKRKLARIDMLRLFQRIQLLNPNKIWEYIFIKFPRNCLLIQSVEISDIKDFKLFNHAA